MDRVRAWSNERDEFWSEHEHVQDVFGSFFRSERFERCFSNGGVAAYDANGAQARVEIVREHVQERRKDAVGSFEQPSEVVIRSTFEYGVELCLRNECQDEVVQIFEMRPQLNRVT